MNDEAKTTNDPWQEDATGLLTGHTRRVSRRRLLVVAATTTGAAGLAVTCGAVGWNAYLQRLATGYQYFGLTCSDVREMLPDYKANRLDAKRSELLELHVRKCSNCKQFLQDLRPQV